MFANDDQMTLLLDTGQQTTLTTALKQWCLLEAASQASRTLIAVGGYYNQPDGEAVTKFH